MTSNFGGMEDTSDNGGMSFDDDGLGLSIVGSQMAGSQSFINNGAFAT